MKQIDMVRNELDNGAIESIFYALRKAETKFPGWPDDVVHGAAIMAEEAGESVKAALDLYYGRGDIANLKKEVAQTGAMAIRFLIYLYRAEALGAGRRV